MPLSSANFRTGAETSSLARSECSLITGSPSALSLAYMRAMAGSTFIAFRSSTGSAKTRFLILKLVASCTSFFHLSRSPTSFSLSFSSTTTSSSSTTSNASRPSSDLLQQVGLGLLPHAPMISLSNPPGTCTPPPGSRPSFPAGLFPVSASLRGRPPRCRPPDA